MLVLIISAIIVNKFTNHFIVGFLKDLTIVADSFKLVE